MQLYLLVVSPSMAQMLSITLCAIIVGRVHLKIISTRRMISMQSFHSVVISCTSIQIFFKMLSYTGVEWMVTCMQLASCI